MTSIALPISQPNLERRLSRSPPIPSSLKPMLCICITAWANLRSVIFKRSILSVFSSFSVSAFFPSPSGALSAEATKVQSASLALALSVGSSACGAVAVTMVGPLKVVVLEPSGLVVVVVVALKVLLEEVALVEELV